MFPDVGQVTLSSPIVWKRRVNQQEIRQLSTNGWQSLSHYSPQMSQYYAVLSATITGSYSSISDILNELQTGNYSTFITFLLVWITLLLLKAKMRVASVQRLCMPTQHATLTLALSQLFDTQSLASSPSSSTCSLLQNALEKKAQVPQIFSSNAF